MKRIFFTLMLLTILSGCGQPIPSVTATKESTATSLSIPLISTQHPTSTLLPSETATPALFAATATLNPTQQTWLSTAIPIQRTKNAVTQQSIEAKSTKIAEFPKVDCNQSSFYSEISPNEEWIATSCGYKRDQTLVVQNKEGIRWVLEFVDFLHPSFSEGTPGRLGVVFWDAGGEYLYFTASVGWSGGGDFCFPEGGGALGLFRLNLKTGSWNTIIERTNRFPGDKIRFSSTGRRYAVDINGIMVTDLQTGEIIQINVSGVMNLNWSPDGTKLAYSTSRCNAEGFVIDSSLYIWDALENESQLILKADKIILSPTSWDDIAMLSISGEDYVDNNTIYTIYTYDITKNELIFIGPDSLLYQ